MNVTKETIYTLTFHMPGVFVGEEFSTPVDHCDPAKVEWRDDAYAFCFFGRDRVTDDKGNTYDGDEEQVGKLYYHPDSVIETLAEVKANRPDETILISNMQTNGLEKIIWTRRGNWPQPYDEKRIEVLPHE